RRKKYRRAETSCQLASEPSTNISDAPATVELCMLYRLRSFGRTRRAPQDDLVAVLSTKLVAGQLPASAGKRRRLPRAGATWSNDSAVREEPLRAWRPEGSGHS